MIALSLISMLLACAADPTTQDSEAVEDTQDTQDTQEDTGVAQDTWDNFGEEFMAVYCVECHSASPKDFRSYEDVVSSAAKIRCGTASRTQDQCGSWPPASQFPIGSGPMPSDEERDAMVAWIDAGMPQ